MKKIASIRSRKALRYLFWLGPCLILMGLTAGAIAGFSPIPISLLALGAIIIGGWIFWESQALRRFWGQRSTQVSTNALAATLAVVIILVLLNVLGVRYGQRFDLTENQIFTLAPQTQELVQNLNQPVKAWIFDISPNPRDRELLTNYQRQGNNFSFEYIDPQVQPTVARQFGVQVIGEVHLEAGDRRRLVQTINAEERLSERGLTNGLVQITSDRQLKVYFLEGHGEKPPQEGQGGIAEAVGRLGEENYASETLNLATNPQVPDDADVLVVAGPQRPLLASEITALETYLQRQGGLMVMVDPTVETGLEELLQSWGVSLSNLLVLDTAGQAAGLGPAVTLVTEYGDHPITQQLVGGISFFPIAQPLGLEPVEGITEAPLLFTSQTAQAQEIPESGDLQLDAEGAQQGPFIIGAALSRPVAETPTPAAPPPPEAVEPTDEPTDENEAANGSENPTAESPITEESPGEEAAPPTAETAESPVAEEAPTEEDAPAAEEVPTEEEETAEGDAPETRLVVIGNSSFITNGLVGQQLNGDVFLNAVNWLSQGEDEVLAIRPRDVTNRRILMGGQQSILLALLAVLGLPLLGFAAAFLVWWRRR